ncbi:unnamed protein product [Trichogramma brassicae]|uniref:Uncharacterized protein n=1 Tax=Trichogramma brassicae TaxID=86971 RepID=A0A6H5J153_9HYME|nr:unnamed protein product [Trichogramma brassicae]
MDDFVKNFLIQSNLHEKFEILEKLDYSKKFEYPIKLEYPKELEYPKNRVLDSNSTSRVFSSTRTALRKRPWSSCWSAKIWSRLYVNTSLSAFIVVLIKTNNSSSIDIRAYTRSTAPPSARPSRDRRPSSSSTAAAQQQHSSLAATTSTSIKKSTADVALWSSEDGLSDCHYVVLDRQVGYAGHLSSWHFRRNEFLGHPLVFRFNKRIGDFRSHR